MTSGPSTISVGDYHDEVLHHTANRPDDYHPATAQEPRRVLTWDGEVLAGSNNGEGRSNWGYRPNVTIHVAVTGSGYAYGASVAACDGALEIGQNAELSDLIKALSVDARLRCRRPACRARWTQIPAPNRRRAHPEMEIG
jgi:hypothetical protein